MKEKKKDAEENKKEKIGKEKKKLVLMDFLMTDSTKKKEYKKERGGKKGLTGKRLDILLAIWGEGKKNGTLCRVGGRGGRRVLWCISKWPARSHRSPREQYKIQLLRARC